MNFPMPLIWKPPGSVDAAESVRLCRWSVLL
jgi:hypothetical protein